jgi:hypothetical protein
VPAVANDRFVFIHVPKTGGGWVSKALEAAGVEAEPVSIEQHPMLCDVDRAGRFTFAFVREPISWYRSLWRFHRAQPQDHWPKLNRYIGLPLPDFLSSVASERPGYLGQYFNCFIGEGGEAIDFVGRIENLADDLVHALTLAGQSFNEATVRAHPYRNPSSFPCAPVPEAVAEQVRTAEHQVYERFYSLATH